MKSLQHVALFIFSLLMVTSCVPTKKYSDLERESVANKRESDSLRSVVDRNRNLKYDIIRLEKALEKSQGTYDELQSRFVALSQNNQNLLFRYDQLIAQNSDILSTSSNEKQNLTEELAAKQNELDQKERELRRIEESLQLEQANLGTLRQNLELRENQLNGGTVPVNSSMTNPSTTLDNDYEAQVNELQRLLQQKDATLFALRESVNKALLGFTAADLQVAEKNGKIYVSLSQNLLFASGSDRIDWKGKKAIIQVAEVLKANPDILVNVEGHTDSDGTAVSNWDLGARRASSVVNVLTGQGINARRITASSRALYDPVAPNNSAANKSLNRRTEIILSPKLDQLYRIMNQ